MPDRSALATPGGTFPIRYAVQGGSPRVDLGLDIAADGSMVVEILTGTTVPQPGPLRLGRFNGHLPAGVLASLVDWAGSMGRSVERRDEAPPPPGTVTRFLGTGGGASQLVSGATVPEGLEDGLSTAAAASLSDPLAAAEVGAAAAMLEIRGMGSEALPILLFARDIPGYWVRVWRDDPAAPGGQAFLGFEDVAGLVEAGRLPEGPVDLAPGAAVCVPLPPNTAGGSRGGFMFWRRGEGLERRLIVGTW